MPATNASIYLPEIPLDIVINPHTNTATFPCCGAEVAHTALLGCAGAPRSAAYSWALDHNKVTGVAYTKNPKFRTIRLTNGLVIDTCRNDYSNGTLSCPECKRVLRAPGRATIQQEEGE